MTYHSAASNIFMSVGRRYGQNLKNKISFTTAICILIINHKISLKVHDNASSNKRSKPYNELYAQL